MWMYFCVLAFGLPSILTYLGNALFNALHKIVWHWGADSLKIDCDHWYCGLFAFFIVLAPGSKELCKSSNDVNAHKITAKLNIQKAVPYFFLLLLFVCLYFYQNSWSPSFKSSDSLCLADLIFFIQLGFSESMLISEIVRSACTMDAKIRVSNIYRYVWNSKPIDFSKPSVPVLDLNPL